MNISPLRKKIIRLLLFYVLMFSAIAFIQLSGKFKGDMCNPGLDILFLLLGIAITFVLLLRSLINVFNKKGSKHLLLINLVAALIWAVLLFM